MTISGDHEPIIGEEAPVTSSPPSSYIPINPKLHTEVVDLTVQALQNPALWERIPHLVIGLYGWDEKRTKKWFHYYRLAILEEHNPKKAKTEKISSKPKGTHSFRLSLEIASAVFLMASACLFLWVSRNDDLRMSKGIPAISLHDKLVGSTVPALMISVAVLIFCYLLLSRAKPTTLEEEKP